MQLYWIGMYVWTCILTPYIHVVYVLLHAIACHVQLVLGNYINLQLHATIAKPKISSSVIIYRGSYRCKNICKVFHLCRIVIDVHLVNYWLCNSCLSYILRACVLVLYIFINVSQACLSDFASWICTIMKSDTLTENQYKTFLAFSCQVLLTWICCYVGFSGKRGSSSSSIMNSR
jgi:hypothetical protein